VTSAFSPERVFIRHPIAEDCDEFIALMFASRELHHPWVFPPETPEQFAEYLARGQSLDSRGLLICERDTGRITGVVNLNCIVQGALQSAYLGYYIGQPYARRGYMTQGLRQAIRYAFDELGLHRLEANIQPGNIASINLVKKLGFQREGFSPRYLQIAGEWRDHERWAILTDAGGNV
jgi:ribosomal-protein-alanine N-acetyltransferase